jgi:plastocyanin
MKQTAVIVSGLAALALIAVPIGTGAWSTAEPEIEMEDFSYRPARMVVPKGALVVWKNRDEAPHNATSVKKRANGARLFKTRTGGFRAEVTARAPRTAGSYRYFCTVHPNMRGTLVVR